jgi:hypothetical protein
MIVYSNHKNLTYFQMTQKLNDQQARWSLYLSGFDLKLIHLPGTKMAQSDALSRWPDYGTNEQMEEEDKVVLPDNFFINLLDTELQERILNGKDFDLDLKNTIDLWWKKDRPAWKMAFKTGRLKKLMNERQYSSKGRIIYIWNFDGTLWKCTTITKQQDIQENWRLTTESDKTIGGQDCERSWRTTYRDVVSVNSSR